MAIFVLLFVVGLVIKYIRWFVGAAALVGMFFVGRAARLRRGESRGGRVETT